MTHGILQLASLFHVESVKQSRGLAGCLFYGDKAYIESREVGILSGVLASIEAVAYLAIILFSPAS